MKQESLKQREQRISYQRSIGIREEGMMHDRFASEEFCEECGDNPCSCKTEKDKEDRLREIRGGM